MFGGRGTPAFIRSDNGPEFIAQEVQDWLNGLKERGCLPHYIDKGSPWQNGYGESFHGKLRDKKLRDELLGREAFASVAEARVRLEAHRVWYNKERPHSRIAA